MRNTAYHVFFTNLANSLKVDVILCLKEKEMNVSEIVDCLKVEQSKVSHALHSLKNCNIVQSEKKGKQRIYSLHKGTIVPMLNLIDKHSKTFCNKSCKDCKDYKGK